MKKILNIMMCSFLCLTIGFLTMAIGNDKEKESVSKPVKEKPEGNANQSTDLIGDLLKKDSQPKTGK